MGAGNRIVAALTLAAGLMAGAVEAQTLEAVKERGHLLCGAAQISAGFAQRDDKGFWSGFDVDFCRAVAAAVLGDADKVEFVAMEGQSRFAPLQTGDVDLIARNAAWTIRRDTGYGAHYVGASFFDGQGFMVPASVTAVSVFELDDVQVCVADTGDELQTLRTFFFENQISYNEVLYEASQDLAVAYRAGRCDMVSAPASQLFAIRKQLNDPAAQRILPERISKEVFGPVVREGDDRWFDIVKWTLFGLINAEELGVTSLNLEPMSEVRTPAIRRLLGVEGDFGAGLGLDPKFMRTVLAAVGNYGEMYDRNFGPQTGAPLLRGQNGMWTKGGLLFAPPIR